MIYNYILCCHILASFMQAKNILRSMPSIIIWPIVSISSCQRNLMKTYHNEANTSGITKIASKNFLEFFEQSTGSPPLVRFLLVRISNQYGFLKPKNSTIFLISTVFSTNSEKILKITRKISEKFSVAFFFLKIFVKVSFFFSFALAHFFGICSF